MTNLIGQTLGRYHILEQLGEGGMAVVYKAFDTRLERNVAIKVILPQKQHTEKFIKRFEREAKALAQLSHPNIVKVIDYGEQDGIPFLVMEYIPGGTLKKKLAGKPMPWRDAVKILIPIARALGYAHQQKIVHRDVKPSNILITGSGEPMLSDFGIAKILEVEETLDLTGTGVGVGTPEYMSPEQAQGKTVDARSDVYSLGVVLYEMVTGRKPYQADTPYAVVIKHVNEPLPNPKQYSINLPGGIENILYKSLAKDIQNRYKSMEEFEKSLDNVSNEPDNRPYEQKKLRFLKVVILGVLAMLLTLIYFINVNNGHQEEISIYTGATQLLNGTGIVTSIPTAGITPTAIVLLDSQPNPASSENEYFYDDFNNPSFDGRFNTSLWQIEYESPAKPKQMDGVLVFSQEKAASTGYETALRASDSGIMTLSSINFLQADLAIGKDTNNRFSHIAVNIVAKNTPKGDLWIEANLYNSTSRPGLLCKIGYFTEGGTVEYEKYYYDDGMSYDKFYTLRIDLNAETSTIQWRINNALVCEYTSVEYANNLERAAAIIINSNRSTGSISTNYIDNIVIGK